MRIFMLTFSLLFFSCSSDSSTQIETQESFVMLDIKSVKYLGNQKDLPTASAQEKLDSIIQTSLQNHNINLLEDSKIDFSYTLELTKRQQKSKTVGYTNDDTPIQTSTSSPSTVAKLTFIFSRNKQVIASASRTRVFFSDINKDWKIEIVQEESDTILKDLGVHSNK